MKGGHWFSSLLCLFSRKLWKWFGTHFIRLLRTKILALSSLNLDHCLVTQAHKSVCYCGWDRKNFWINTCQFAIRPSSCGRTKSWWKWKILLVFENMCWRVSAGRKGCWRFSLSSRKKNTCERTIRKNGLNIHSIVTQHNSDVVLHKFRLPYSGTLTFPLQ